MTAPLISIIIPTYRRPEHLLQCLAAVSAQEYPPERFETIVVDDGGGLPREEVERRWPDGAHLVLLSQAHAGPAAARNRGATRARGRFLVFIDDDCVPPSRWLRSLEARLTADPDTLVGGLLVNTQTDNVLAIASDLLIQYLFGYCNPDPDSATFLVSGNMALSAQRFHDLGGFDRRFTFAGGEDREFCSRWMRAGRRAVYSSESLVYHRHPMTLGAFFRQHFNYGRGASRFRQARAKVTAVEGRIERWPFYLGLFRLPFDQGFQVRAPLLAGLLFLSQLLSTLGFVRDRLLRDA